MKSDVDSDFDPEDYGRPGTHPLVVLAVILAVATILASIVVPNVADYGMGPMTHGISGIGGIELALTKMAADAYVTSLAGLFDLPALREAQRATAAQGGLSAMHAATSVYTTVFYALLHHGRGAPAVLAQDPATLSLANILKPAVVGKLGTSYLDLADDPWGQPYQIYPGPWNRAEGTVPFRVYSNLYDDERSPVPDTLTLAVSTDHGPAAVGYPADRNRIAFIWSLGKNEKNDQPHFGDVATYPGSPRLRYRDDARPEELGGGDDVNNWDNTRSFEHFYR